VCVGVKFYPHTHFNRHRLPDDSEGWSDLMEVKIERGTMLALLYRMCKIEQLV